MIPLSAVRTTARTPFVACTIASNNYLAYAKVWAESMRRHHPEATLYACIVDRPDANVDYAELPFETIFVDQLGIPVFENFAFRYDILELNTAVKPYLLSYLRDHLGHRRAFYFDPDIWVTSPMPELVEALERHPIVLTPHIAEPLDDDERPQERLLRMAGIYNLGFVGFRLDSSTADFLAWWCDRLYRHCLNDLQQGLFVDQAWMDFAPAFVDRVGILRDPRYNIAYWNLPHRQLTWRDGNWEVAQPGAGDRRVGFVHFSGLDLDRVETVSRHQERVRLSARPELRPLFEGYREAIFAAGHERFRPLPYAFGTFSETPVLVPPLARRLLQRLDPKGRRWPNPFDAHRDDSFLAYLLEPLYFAQGRLNRIALAYWEERGDLLRAFPDVCGADLAAYSRWLGGGEGARAGLPPCFLAALGPKPAEESAASKQRFSFALHPYDATVSETGVRLLAHVDLSRPGSHTAWLNEPIPGTLSARPKISRLALLLYRTRLDLQKAFPDPLATDQAKFARWFCIEGVREFELHPDLVRPVAETLGWRGRLRAMSARWRRPADLAAAPPHPESEPQTAPAALELTARSSVPRHGVNVAGYFGSNTGVAQIGRGSLRAIAHAGLESVPIHLDRDLWGRQVRGRITQPAGAPFPITLLHANADETPRVLGMLPAAATAGGYVVGCWFWELSHFPLNLAHSFDHLHEIWAPTRFCEAAFLPLSTVPVRYVPPCVLPPVPLAGDSVLANIESLGRGRFRFLVCFDAQSYPERKNPLAAIDAFERLIRSSPVRPVALVVQVTNAAARPDWLAALRERARGLPIEILGESFERVGIEALLGSSDALVSLHRSEGLGLLPIEAMYLAKPVIATAYGGVTDYLDQRTGFPIGFSLTRVGSDLGPYPAQAVWAEPNVVEASEAMRRILADPVDAGQRAVAGARRVRELYSVEAAAARYATELHRIQDLLERRAGAHANSGFRSGSGTPVATAAVSAGSIVADR